MGANNTFVTGLGGFNTGEGVADGYQGTPGQLPGAGEMTASAMFLARPNYEPSSGPASDAALIGNRDGGPLAGWQLLMRGTGGTQNEESVEVAARAVDDTAGEVTVEVGIEGVLSNVHIATMRLSVSSGAEGELAIFLDGIKNSVPFDVPATPVYVPSPEEPTVGYITIPGFVSPFFPGYILGCAYAELAFTDEEIWRHQMTSLQAGDIVDGSQGQAFGAGAPTFTNLWSARRTNSAFNVPASSFITGLQGGTFNGLTVGQVPPGAAVWTPSSGSINLNRIDTGAIPAVFVTGLKSLY